MKKLLYLLSFIFLGTGSVYSQVSPREKQQLLKQRNDIAWMQKNLQLSNKQIYEIKKLNQEQLKHAQRLNHSSKLAIQKNIEQQIRNRKIQQAKIQHAKIQQIQNRQAKIQRILTKEQFAKLQKHQARQRLNTYHNQKMKSLKDRREMPRAEKPRTSHRSR